ncbi:WD40 repeat domain-containing protein [Mycoavidus sp. SF9855]|uniref:WD40 repeat domain-containing protein n=1 Tax=Mycoavidus sp. SF9855 TaxID=2968475 RepID=UPI00211D038A|nr:hypothetical protein [Mycoavidus sp. SF9855]UUM20817.1 hypothetical protein NQD60_04865 [Mycoavidus sp. SF9855]
MVYPLSGSQIASGSGDKTVRLWDAHSGAAVHILEGHTSYVNSVEYSPSGVQIASDSKDNTVRLWDVSSGECLSVIQGFSGFVFSVAWKAMSDGAYLVTGSGDKSVRKWAVKQDPAGYQVVLHWSSGHEGLTVQGALLEGVHGLSEVNRALLTQRGALEGRYALSEPEPEPEPEPELTVGHRPVEAKGRWRAFRSRLSVAD